MAGGSSSSTMMSADETLITFHANSSNLSSTFDSIAANSTTPFDNSTKSDSRTFPSNTTFEAIDIFFFTNESDPEDIPNLSFANDFKNESNPDVPFYLNFRDEPWVVPLASFCFFNIAVIIIFEIYVLYKSCGGRRHLFLGQVLLFGLFLCSALGLLYVPHWDWLFCGMTRVGVGVAYTIVFGTLLVKCLFLLKLHHGVYINASFQAFLLFFIIGVEIAVVSMWLIYEPPEIVTFTHTGGLRMVCQKSPIERIVYLAYPMFLLFLVIIASIRTRSIKDNNREALYIGLSVATSVVVWVAWISLALIFDRKYEAPAEAFGLVCTAIFIFLFVFIPKAVQLAYPHGNMATDSTVGSHSVIHTPSFYHLQPQAVLPSSVQGTLIKQSNVNADFCRGYTDRIWTYDIPSFRQITPPEIAISEMNSLKKSNTSSLNRSHHY